MADGREGRSGRLEQITPVQRAQIVELACLEPIAKGLHITHWSSQDLARQAVEDGIVGSISPATVRRLLHDVDLQPHRTRSGRRPVWMPGSKSERSKSFGATGMRSDWLNKASGSNGIKTAITLSGITP